MVNQCNKNTIFFSHREKKVMLHISAVVCITNSGGFGKLGLALVAVVLLFPENCSVFFIVGGNLMTLVAFGMLIRG